MVPMGVVPGPVLCGACLPVATGFRDQLVPTCLEGWPVPGEAWAPARLARAEGRALRRQVSDSGAQPFRGQSRLMAFLLGPGAAQEAADPHNGSSGTWEGRAPDGRIALTLAPHNLDPDPAPTLRTVPLTAPQLTGRVQTLLWPGRGSGGRCPVAQAGLWVGRALGRGHGRSAGGGAGGQAVARGSNLAPQPVSCHEGLFGQDCPCFPTQGRRVGVVCEGPPCWPWEKAARQVEGGGPFPYLGLGITSGGAEPVAGGDAPGAGGRGSATARFGQGPRVRAGPGCRCQRWGQDGP